MLLPKNYFSIYYVLSGTSVDLWSTPSIDIFFFFFLFKNDACPFIQFLPRYICAMFLIYFPPFCSENGEALLPYVPSFDPLSIKGIYGTLSASFIHHRRSNRLFLFLVFFTSAFFEPPSSLPAIACAFNCFFKRRKLWHFGMYWSVFYNLPIWPPPEPCVWYEIVSLFHFCL